MEGASDPTGPDFLEGIDDHFNRLMDLPGSDTKAARLPSQPSIDPVMQEIEESLGELSKRKRQEVLRFIRTLKEKSE